MIAAKSADTGLESGPIRRGKLLGRFFTMRCKFIQ